MPGFLERLESEKRIQAAKAALATDDSGTQWVEKQKPQTPRELYLGSNFPSLLERLAKAKPVEVKEFEWDKHGQIHFPLLDSFPYAGLSVEGPGAESRYTEAFGVLVYQSSQRDIRSKRGSQREIFSSTYLGFIIETDPSGKIIVIGNRRVTVMSHANYGAQEDALEVGFTNPALYKATYRRLK